MLLKRACEARNQAAEPCRQAPLRDARFCFWHSPDHADEAAKARQLGGNRRKREGALAGAYDFDGLQSIPQLRRLLEVAAYDALALENSVARVRALIALVQAGAKLLEVGEFEQRLESLEQAMGPRLKTAGGRR